MGESESRRWHRQWDLFHSARELPHQERRAFLEQNCGDPSLRQEVEELLSASDEAGAAFPTDGASRLLSSAHRRQAAAGDVLGPYRLVSQLGEGGMGQVFLATQEEPIQRAVALKVIKRGMDSDEVVARFAGERQILARMSHPNVATVLDGGLSPDGQPYFVMERVDGQPIDRFCDHHRYDLASRIRLMIQVCSAVQHAHHKGIVHRDLKPSNVLVADIDGQPVPKVIDFGIAKALHGVDTPSSTAIGRVLGTPDFMSPEQLAGGGRDVDSRTDVYALGVLLYRLITGCLPHDRSGTPSAPRPVQSAPSTGRSSATGLVRRLSQLDLEQRQEIAEMRRLRPAELLRQLRGELEWIVDKAMADERELRYASCSELAADLERYLAREAVLAGPPSARYRVAKLMARYRPQFLIAGISLLFLIVLAIGLAIQSTRLRAALDEARAENARRQKVTDFLVDTFRVSDPDRPSSTSTLRNPSAREVLDDGAARVLDELDDPALYGPLVETLGRIYGNLGEYRREVELLRAAVEKGHQDHGQPLELARSLHILGTAEARAGDWKEAENSLSSAFDLRRQLLGQDHADTLDSEYALGVLRHRMGDNPGARKILERVLAKRLEGDDGSSIQVARTQVSLGNTLRYLDDFERAIELHEQALERFQRLLPEDDRRITGTLNGLALVYERVDRNVEAVQIYHQILEREIARLGPSHPDIAAFKVNLALVLLRQDRFDEAAVISAEALSTMQESLGENDLRTLQTARNHAAALFWSGETEMAIDNLRDVRRRMEALVSPEHAELHLTLAILASFLIDLERWSEAEPLLARLMEATARQEKPTATLMRRAAQWGQALSKLGHHARGEALMSEALEFRLEHFGPEHPKTLDTWNRLEEHLERLGKVDEIETWRERLGVSELEEST